MCVEAWFCQIRSQILNTRNALKLNVHTMLTITISKTTEGIDDLVLSTLLGWYILVQAYHQTTLCYKVPATINNFRHPSSEN